ncbi:uncharacterized protein LOC126834058 [Adelges cooleyi]|uniref:uncharacterized protein LOC126834058 n=1 Tax=Adelges cooleyi TaxID=133065 RepID=UPI0021804325|nr:uncharacterized protein LOC126834058 [Adelges cooleyi]
MTNNKLQVLYFYAVTICIVTNNIKCASQDEYRDQICKTNYILRDLNDDQKEQLVNQLIQGYTDARIQVLIFPPVTAFFSNRVKARAFESIITREWNIQELLSVIIGREPTIDSINPIDYDTAVNSRYVVLHTIFNYVLHQRMNRIQMCNNGEITKCRLLGIITRALNPGFRYTQGCNEVLNCVIGLEAKGDRPVQMIEYVDLILPEGFFKTELDMN